jgi:hypothetical protein
MFCFSVRRAQELETTKYTQRESYFLYFVLSKVFFVQNFFVNNHRVKPIE